MEKLRIICLWGCGGLSEWFFIELIFVEKKLYGNDSCTTEMHEANAEVHRGFLMEL